MIRNLVATGLFIMSLRWMSNPETARKGVFSGVAAMVLAVAGTLAGVITTGGTHYWWILAAFIAGSAVGYPLAQVPLTAVPQRTALSHAFGGLAAGLVGTGKFFLYYGQSNEEALAPYIVTALMLEILLGFLTFTGSLMAAGKLQELKWIPQRPVTYPGQNVINLGLFTLALALGFLLGCYGIVWCEKSSTLLSMTAPLLALSVPLLDAALAVVRRFLRKQPIFGADRSHIHHKLLSKGLTPRRVVLVLYGCCALAAAASLMLTALHQKYQGFIIVLVSLVALLGLQNLGYREFSIAGKLAFDGSFRRLLNAELVLIGFEQELSDAATLEQSWEVLCRTGPQFGFTGSELKLDGVVCRGEPGGGWRVRIEFPGHGYINLNRKPGITDRGAAAVLFIDRTSRVVTSKLKDMESVAPESQIYANAD